MTSRKKKEALDTSTEEKIKVAARTVFHQKGFAATRTRDIAEEAGINLALLNYYFRSKEKLFKLIMLETVAGFMGGMTIVFNDPDTPLEEKVALLVDRYIDTAIAEPEIPLFIMSELRNNPHEFLEKLPIGKMLMHSAFIRQYQDAVAEGRIVEPNPLHFIMNVIGLVIFPFIGRPILQNVGSLNNQEFEQLMQQRKKLIPVWIQAIMKAG